VPLRSNSLPFLIENSRNQNSSQLADNKQKPPVLIENFEPNRARVFVPSHAQQIAPADAAQLQFTAFLTETAPQTEIDVTRSKQTVGSFLTETRIASLISRSPFLTGSVPQTEFTVTHSKQTLEKILTGARMHIRISSFGHAKRRSLLAVASSPAVAALRSWTCLPAVAGLRG
jgi:hypothetical protein